MKKFVWIFVILLLVGCGRVESPTYSERNCSENISLDNDSGNGTQDIEENFVVKELDNGLFAYITTEVSRDIEIDGIKEWIVIQDMDPENGTYYDIRWRNVDLLAEGNWILIPNVYGTINDIRMENNSEIEIQYKNEEVENGKTVIPMDFYLSDGMVIGTIYDWASVRALAFNIDELTNETSLPIVVWKKTFISNGREYEITYSRVSPIYSEDYIEGMHLQADYQYTIRQGDRIVYETKLYGMAVEYEEVHYLEDINGDGINDVIQLTNHGFYPEETVPYVFIWNPETEICISAGTIAPEEITSYEEWRWIFAPFYQGTCYDRETGIFYDTYEMAEQYYYGHYIVCGAKFINGEWRTVYELYLGEEGEDYARETKYDESGNVNSEITYTEEECYAIVGEIYDACELNLYDERYLNLDKEEVNINDQFSYWKYVRKEE